MHALSRAIKDLVIANRILARQGVVDAFGEISIRHPGDPSRFLLACGKYPGAVVADDIIEFGNADGSAACAGPLPKQRFIHAAIYAVRPDVTAILHASPEDILPFTITNEPFRPMIGSVGDMGCEVAVWDIAEKFGEATAIEVTTMEQGRELARRLGSSRVLLIRGEGMVVTGRSLNDVVRLSVYLPRNGRTIVSSQQFAPLRSLSSGEVAARLAIDPESNAMRRGWKYWARDAGCGELLAD